MANKSPHQARLGKRLRGKPLDMPQLLLVLSYALKRAQAVLEDAIDDDDLTLKAVHAVSQVSGQYCKLLQIGEYEARLAAVEAAQKGMGL